MGLLAFFLMLGFDLLFLAALVLAVVPLGMYRQAAFAVLKRNFFGYFSNPTGYVFICLFVLVGSVFAFWPHDFFNSNLATLGELNKNFSFVMLLLCIVLIWCMVISRKGMGSIQRRHCGRRHYLYAEEEIDR